MFSRYNYHFPIGNKWILLSNQHLFCIQTCHEEWVVDLREIRGLQFIPSTEMIVVLLAKYTSSSVFETPTNKRIIPLSGTSAAMYAEKIYQGLLTNLKDLKHPIVRDVEEKS